MPLLAGNGPATSVPRGSRTAPLDCLLYDSIGMRASSATPIAKVQTVNGYPTQAINVSYSVGQ